MRDRRDSPAAAAAVLGVLVLGGGCAGEDPGPTPWFEECAAASGLDFVHASGADGRFWFPEIATGGVALLDHDGDGALDVYFVNGGALDPAAVEPAGNRLYRNVDGGRFEDVTGAAGVGDRGYGMGAACADHDGDGDVDLYVTNVGPNVLYDNEGDGTFADQSEASGADGDSWGTSCAFLDHDRDGDLDLFVTNYVLWSFATEQPCTADSGAREYCGPNSYDAPAPDTLYRNEGDGRFTDVSEAAGIRAAFGNGLGVACADFDGNGWIDVYVANDGNPNQLWRNGGDGRFRNTALETGSAVNAAGQAEAGMGVQVVDVDQDGVNDLFLSHLRHETNTFYRGQDGWFEDATAEFGFASTSYACTGFGLGFADFDHDGWLDLYVANGRVQRWDPAFDPDDLYAEPDQLYAGTAGARFREVSPPGGTAQELVHTGRGAAFGDLDDDGDVDIVVVNRDGPAYLLRNVAARGHWLSLRVLERDGREALFAGVLARVGGRVMRRTVQRAYSYCASNDPRVHFGLGDALQAETVEVTWTDGAREVFGPLAADRQHVLRRGEGR